MSMQDSQAFTFFLIIKLHKEWGYFVQRLLRGMVFRYDNVYALQQGLGEAYIYT